MLREKTVTTRFVLLVLLVSSFCKGDEVQCSRYHYEEQTLSKVLRLEHKLELLTEEVLKQKDEYYIEVRLHLKEMKTRLEKLEDEKASRTHATEMCAYCPNGWIRYEGSCYFFVEETLNHSDAKVNCEVLGGELVHVDNFAENNFIISHLKTLKVDLSGWMGLSDVEKEGTFKWNDGNVMTFSDWGNSEPNGGASENCVHFYGGKSFKWNDVRCSATFGSVCEKSN